jgi:hypothetical protein
MALLDALQIMRPHDLVGQRGFSFLVTGTVTVLEDNRSLTLQAVDDVIVRGNLNLPGDGSDLVLQSDKWVYWEGTGTIGGDLTIAGGMELDGTSHNGAGGRRRQRADSRHLATGDSQSRQCDRHPRSSGR